MLFKVRNLYLSIAVHEHDGINSTIMAHNFHFNPYSVGLLRARAGLATAEADVSVSG